MKIVKDGLFNRDYYIYIKSLKQIELYAYVWDSSIEKYVPNHNMVIEKDVSIERWEKFKEEMKVKGYIHINKALKIGSKRK